ncbi:MAG: hypothetical protein ACRYG8_29850 [Janthinobacterium lividum]
MKAAAGAVAKRVLPKKTEAPAAPKSNKAELEAQIVKLERTVARLRKLNAELRQTRKDAAKAVQPAAIAAAKPARMPKQASAARTRRAAKPTSEPATAVLATDEILTPEG